VVGGDWPRYLNFDSYLPAQNRGTGARLCSQGVTESVVRGDAVHSSVTPDDYASESEAQFAAEKIIRKL